MRVAIIGTREPKASHRQLLVDWAKILAEKGIRGTTGFATGSDMACVEGYAAVDPKLLDLYLPWATYNQTPYKGKPGYAIPAGVNVTVYNPSVHKVWTDSVYKYHTRPDLLSSGGFSLMARNYGIVMHPTPVDAVIALPSNKPGWGGTGEGIRIAQENGILLFNLMENDGMDRAAWWIDSL